LLKATGAATCIVTATKAASPGYLKATSAPTTFIFTMVAQATLTVSNTPLTGTVGTNIALTTSGGSGTGEGTFWVTGSGCSVSGASLDATAAVACIVTARKAASPGYLEATSAPTTFTFTAAQADALVAQATLWVAGPTQLQLQGGQWLELRTFGGSGKGAVTFSVTGTCKRSVTYEGKTELSANAPATCIVTARKAASTGWLAATSEPKTFTWGYAQATLTVSNTTLTGTAGTAITLETLGGSGDGAVTFIARAGCTVTGTSMIATAAGTCIVTATKAASTGYLAATSEAKTFTFTAAPVAQATRTVTFNANGGENTMADQTANQLTPLKANEFTKTGFAFDGWSTTLNGTNAYANGAPYPFTANATLYARWVCKPFTVTATARRQTTRSVVVRYTSTSEVPMTTLTAKNSPYSGFTKSITRSENGGQIIVNLLDPKKLYSWTMTGTNTAGCSATSQPTTPNV
jgi:uncharacterized repeat protein (TIGR02543 family)